MAECKDRGRERRESTALNMSAIPLLKNFRSMYGCDLRPNRSKGLCASCSEYKKCKSLKGERDYIHNSEAATVENKKRQRRAAAQERKTPEDIILLPEEEADAAFPCGEMAFACPDKEKCDSGKNCRW